MDGFDTSELMDFADELMELAKDFPKEQKEILREEAKKQLKEIKTVANREVSKGKAKVNKGGRVLNYHKRFKYTKVFDLEKGKTAIRVYSSAPHAHLIEYGYMLTSKSGKKIRFVSGKHIFQRAYDSYQKKFQESMEDFINNLLDKGIG